MEKHSFWFRRWWLWRYPIAWQGWAAWPTFIAIALVVGPGTPRLLSHFGIALNPRVELNIQAFGVLLDVAGLYVVMMMKTEPRLPKYGNRP